MTTAWNFWRLSCVAFVAALCVFAASCDDDDADFGLSLDCQDMGGVWEFTFSEPIDFNLIVLCARQNPQAADGDVCELFLQDYSVDQSAFDGFVDGDQFRAAIRVGRFWELRGTLFPDMDGNLTLADGFYTLGNESGTFSAVKIINRLDTNQSPLSGEVTVSCPDI